MKDRGQLAQGHWCILRTGGQRTIPVARSLGEAGFEVWTPIATKDCRRARSRVTVERDIAIMPTFVFARADRIDDLRAIIDAPTSPHPQFSIFHWGGRIPLVSDREIASLRYAEERAGAERPKPKPVQFKSGDPVRVVDRNFLGLSGTVVQNSSGSFTLVCFGGAQNISIATWLLRDDDVTDANLLGGERPGAA